MKVSIKLPDLKAKSELMKKQIKEGLEQAVISETTVMKARILKGIDTDNSSVAGYAPYVPSYAKKRKSKGRPINKVDWSFTGALIRSIIYEISDKGNKLIAEIYPKGKEEILESLLKKRPKHWGFSSKSLERINKFIKDKIKL